MLHDVNNGFFNESFPVAERTTIFTDIRNLMTPNNTLKKRGINCKKVGGCIAEYNFKFFRTEDTVGDQFLHAMAAMYRPFLATNSLFKMKKYLN